MKELKVRWVCPSQLLLHLHWLVSFSLPPSSPLRHTVLSHDEDMLDDWAIPVLCRDHHGDAPHAADVGAAHPGSSGRRQRRVARWPLVLFCRWNLVVLRLQRVLVQVGRRHGAQGGTLAAHSETARRGNTALRRGHVLSKGKQKHN